MYQAEDRVLYGIHGICAVTAQEEKVVDRKRVTYLVLEPEGQPGARFMVPTHDPAAMGKLRAMLTRPEMEALLSSDEIRTDGWITDENRRKQTYRELIGSGDRVKLMQMVYTLYRHKASQQAAGRKVHLCDDNFLRDAEKLLCSEIASVMGLENDRARAYLREQLKV